MPGAPEYPSIAWTEPAFVALRTMGRGGWLGRATVFGAFGLTFGGVMLLETRPWGLLENVALVVVPSLLLTVMTTSPGLWRGVLVTAENIHAIGQPWTSFCSTGLWTRAEIKQVVLLWPLEGENRF